MYSIRNILRQNLAKDKFHNINCNINKFLTNNDFRQIACINTTQEICLLTYCSVIIEGSDN